MSERANLPARVLVTLSRQRLSRRFAGRFGWFAAVSVLAITIVLMLVGDDPRRVINDGVRWSLWLALGPLALSMADQPVQRDRDDGIEMLVCARGHSRGQLAAARLFAAMIELTVRLIPAIAPSLVLAAATAQPRLLWHAAGLALFAPLAGCVLATVAIVTGYLAVRGRLAFACIVILPAALAGLGGWGGWSIPGSLDALLVALTGVT